MTGVDIIRKHVATLPPTPGVYRMLDKDGNALYVGKAKSLKNRVSSYANTGGLSQRIARMVMQTANMEFVTTQTEAEALLLEANLVQRLNPRYNILLRDDKSFPFIEITRHDFPRIVKFRGPQAPKGEYYGPFATVSAVNEALATLQKGFLLRPCSDTVFQGRTRPCLQYQIKRCSAPCVGLVEKESYGALVTQGRNFLKGKSRDIQDALFKEMAEASIALDYEKAAQLRDRIKALTRVQQEQGLQTASIQDADVIGLYRSGDRTCVQIFFFRSGQNYGNKSYFPNHAAESTTEEILSAFIGQFYQTHLPPKTMLLSESINHLPLLEEALLMRAGYKVRIEIPQRGEKLQVTQYVLKNARQALERYQMEQSNQHQLLEGVAKLFALGSTPERIEVYDNSHIMGRQAVGGMIAAGPEGFIKSGYRRFTIKNTELAPTGGDDYAMMREVLTRRFSRLQREDGAALWPDLVLIDGGAAHLKVVEEVFAELGISDMPFVCISKGRDRNAGREWLHLPGGIAPFQLPPHDAVLHYLQRLRDEAHRYAIGSHRLKRSNALSTSELDQITGIGALRKKALLHHFGSARSVGAASLAELEKVAGINKKTALTIYNYFHS